jgi:hypothetical protein
MTIDEKYIDKLCLPNIRKVKDGVYRFQFVFCSLSETNPNKWKGYLYQKGNSYNYYCHKCNHRSSLKNIIKGLDPKLHLKYVTQRFQDIFPPKIEYSPEHERITKK